MSMPKIEKNENPVEREQSVSNLIESVAMMEAGLSHIINAEGEKIQKVVKYDSDEEVPIEDLLKVNDSVGKMVNSVSKLEMILQNKLDISKELDTEESTTGGLNAFGGIYNEQIASQSGLANEPIIIAMPSYAPSKNLSFTSPNSITILKGGIYHMTYEMLASFDVAANLIVSIRSNGVNIPQTETEISIGAIAPVYYSGSTIVELPEGAVIDMSVTSDVDVTINFDEASIRGINLFKLD